MTADTDESLEEWETQESIKASNSSERNDELDNEIVSVLGAEGKFSKKLANYSHRESQVEMAQAVAQAIEAKQTILAESGTGTGKTFAYLVPAFLSERKTLISTGTKHLQEQLFHRDIPTVLDAMSASAKVSLLKGRANYLCLQRLQIARVSARRLDLKKKKELEHIVNVLPRCKSGDIAEIAEVPEDSSLWPQVTSTVDNCLGQACSYFEDCYVNKARKAALSSDVIVINHHLFFADRALKEDGFGALLPEVECIVFDEAHQLPDIASNFLGKSFSSWQVLELASDTRTAELLEKSLIADIEPRTQQLEKYCADFRLSLGLNERRISWDDLLEENPLLDKKLKKLAEKLHSFADLLEEASVAGEALSRCYERAVELAQSCTGLANDDSESVMVRWVEMAKRTFRIHETPLDIGNALDEYFGNNNTARVFTSATLSVAGDFSHFKQSAGLAESTQEHTWDSPFNYFDQAVLYVPEGLPEPKDDRFAESIFEEVQPLLTASQGNAFLLFTSFRVMQQFADCLEEHCPDEYTVLMQGETNKRELLQSFVKQPKAVLLGTMSFWEGVDVPGDALKLVVIDKLPFESPFEPVLKARLKAMQEEGKHPFMNYQVPRAVITLRQGAGRLIRSQNDKGVLMICDTRLRGTHYGKKFLESLPRMRRTADREKVCGFLESLSKNTSRSKSNAANKATSTPEDKA